jgi:hypothetical protein
MFSSVNLMSLHWFNDRIMELYHTKGKKGNVITVTGRGGNYIMPYYIIRVPMYQLSSQEAKDLLIPIVRGVTYREPLQPSVHLQSPLRWLHTAPFRHWHCSPQVGPHKPSGHSDVA